jgi:hypothetical protein
MPPDYKLVSSALTNAFGFFGLAVTAVCIQPCLVDHPESSVISNSAVLYVVRTNETTAS